MQTTIDTIRKAAVLVSCLDDDTADKLLDQMPADMADRVRRALADLDRIDLAEQEAVMVEFVRGDEVEDAEDGDAGVELSDKLAREFGLHRSAGAIGPAALQDNSPPFSLLHGSTAERIASLLRSENPQTVALVASHLPTAQAMQVLASLSNDVQADVLRRMADLNEAHPEIILEVERGLASRMETTASKDSWQADRLNLLGEILRHAPAHARRSILENLKLHEPGLADQLCGPGLVDEPRVAAAIEIPQEILPAASAGHASLDELDDVTLSRVLESADAKMVTLALAGGGQALVERVARRLPHREAKQFRRALDKLGPTRLSDIAAAQQELLAAANQFVGAGRAGIAPATAKAA